MTFAPCFASSSAAGQDPRNRLVISGQRHPAGKADAVAQEPDAGRIQPLRVGRNGIVQRRKNQSERRLVGGKCRHAQRAVRRRHASELQKLTSGTDHWCLLSGQPVSGTIVPLFAAGSRRDCAGLGARLVELRGTQPQTFGGYGRDSALCVSAARTSPEPRAPSHESSPGLRPPFVPENSRAPGAGRSRAV